MLAVDPVQTEIPKGVEALWNLERLPDLLAASGFVVIAAPHTPATVKMFRLDQFRAMKPTAYLINVGRGVIVDLAAFPVFEQKVAPVRCAKPIRGLRQNVPGVSPNEMRGVAVRRWRVFTSRIWQTKRSA